MSKTATMAQGFMMATLCLYACSGNPDARSDGEWVGFGISAVGRQMDVQDWPRAMRAVSRGTTAERLAVPAKQVRMMLPS